MATAPRYAYSYYDGGAPRPVRATFVESGAVTVPDDEGQCVVGLCGSSSSKTSASSEVDGKSSFVSTQLGSALLMSVLYGQQDVGSDYGSREILSDFRCGGRIDVGELAKWCVALALNLCCTFVVSHSF